MPVPVYNEPAKGKARLSQRRRELMHRVMDGRSDLAGVMQMLHGYKFCDNFLIFMIENRWTGDHLADVLVKKFHSSVPSMIEFMVYAMRRMEVDVARTKSDQT